MQQIIEERAIALPTALRALLPPRLCRALDALACGTGRVEEIRLRRDRMASVTVNGRNLRLAVCLSGEELDGVLHAMCKGAPYAFEQELCRGYLTMEGGIRVGVCGHAGVRDGRVVGVRDLATLAIRLPCPTPLVGQEICALLHEMRLARGVLLYAPPGVGKTTLLRAVAARMAGGEDPCRVAVIDTRGELGYALRAPELLVDVLSGYPRGAAISIAVRTLAAQLMISDEIGDLAEAEEILAAHAAGVPLVASAHAADLDELLARPGIGLLHKARVFGAYVGIARRVGEMDFSYRITLADALL